MTAGQSGLDRRLTRVNVMQIPTAEFARSDELVLCTTTAFEHESPPSAGLIAELADRGVAALAGQRRVVEAFGEAARLEADQRRLPLVELREDASLNSVLHEVLERLVAAQTAQLELDRRVRDQLADFVLSGSALEDLPLAMSALTGSHVVVTDSTGEPLAASPGSPIGDCRELVREWVAQRFSAPAETDDGWILWPVIGEGRCLGCLAAWAPGHREPIHAAVLEHGSTAAALAILAGRAAAAETMRLHERFIRDLLGESLGEDAARERAAALGWRPDEPYRVLVALGADGDPAPLLHRARSNGASEWLIVEHGGACLGIVPRGHGDSAVVRLARQLADDVAGVKVGVSAMHEGLEELPHAVVQATDMLRTARAFPARSVRWFDSLDPLRILALVSREELESFSDHVLAGLDALPTDRRDPLIKTLELLLETELNVAAAARSGDWHYNTVRDRIRRLTELIGPFMENGERLRSVALALLIRRELGSQSDLPSLPNGLFARTG